MVDNRSAGLIGSIVGGISFRGDDSTASKTADDRASQGSEYFLQEGEEQNTQKEDFIDRSVELRASLNSLALLNVVSLLRNNRNKSIISDDEDLTEIIRPKRVEKIGEDKKGKEFTA